MNGPHVTSVEHNKNIGQGAFVYRSELGRYEVTKRFGIVCWLSNGQRKEVTVPPGFKLDGASGPAMDVGESWVYHDWLAKKQADQILYFVLELEGRNIRKYVWYNATRFFGAFAWRNGPNNQRNNN